MSKLTPVWLIAIIFVVSVPLRGQTTLSLRTALEKSLANSNTLKKADLDRQITEARSLQEKSIIYPQISAGATLDYFPLLPTSLVPGEFINQPGTFIPVQFGQPWQTGAQLTISQLLYNESYRRAIPARKFALELSSLMKEKGQEQVIYEVSSLFLQIRQTEAISATIEANEKRLKALEKAVQASVDNGFAITTDVRRIQLAQQNLQSQKQNLSDALIYQGELLAFLMGAESESTLIPSPTDTIPALSNASTPAKNLIDQRLISTGITLQHIKKRSAKAETRPSATAFATGTYQTQRQNPNFFDRDGQWFGMGLIGIRLYVPITDGGRLKNRLRQIDAETRKLELDAKNLEEYQKIEQKNTSRLLMAAQTQETIRKEALSLATEIYEKLRLQYQQGNIVLSELLEAQTALADAETQLAIQQVNVQIARLKLHKAYGQLQVLMQ